MDYFLLVVFLMIQCRHTYVLDVLPAPINVSMDSKNFRHELKWDPGPGTPPGTYYKVFTRRRQKITVVNKTSTVLKLSSQPTYKISVQAVYNHLESLMSEVFIFTPSKDTKIDTPLLSLVGGDHRLELNISLPKAHRSAKIQDIKKFYDAKVTIFWKKAGDRRPASMDMTNSSMVLENLEAGVEYCVKVHMIIRINSNTRSSDCVYASTSDPEPNIAPKVLGITVPVLILVVVCMVGLLVALHYTGSLCGIKARLPAIMLMVLTHGYLITPETTIVKPVYINPEADKQRARNAQSQPAVQGTGLEDYDEEDEEDADEEETLYFNRAAELSSDPDSQDAPGDSSGNSSASACPIMDRVVLPVEWLLPGSHGQPDIRGHSVKGPVMLHEDPHGIVGRAMSQGEWNEEGVSVDERWEEAEQSDVNLFSVTLLKEDNSGNINLCSAIFDGSEEATDHEMGGENAPCFSLSPLHDREPHRTPSSPASHSCTPSDTEEVVLDPGQPHGVATGYKARRGREDAGTTCGKLISHGGMTDNEEQQEVDSSGYLGRY
ncbi:unnamed protein product [Lota lota]